MCLGILTSITAKSWLHAHSIYVLVTSAFGLNVSALYLYLRFEVPTIHVLCAWSRLVRGSGIPITSGGSRNITSKGRSWSWFVLNTSEKLQYLGSLMTYVAITW